MRTVIEFLFPKRLARLSYFFRILLCSGVLFALYQDLSAETLPGILALILMEFYSAVFVILPRIRDIGMSAGWIALAFIPYVASVLGVVLLFRRSNLAGNPLLQRPAGRSIPLRPEAGA